VSPQKNRLQGFSVDAIPWWKTRIQTLEPVHIPDVEALPAEAEFEKNEFRSQGIRSLVCLPMQDDKGGLMGLMGFDAVRGRYIWPENQIRMLQVIAQIIAGAITRREAYRAVYEERRRLADIIRSDGRGRRAGSQQTDPLRG
jgi:GAF domain-containing protein